VAGAKLRVRNTCVNVWSAVDVGSKELLVLETSYGRSIEGLSLEPLSHIKPLNLLGESLNYSLYLPVTNPAQVL